MGKNQVKISQLALLLMLVITGGKFLSLPSLLAEDVGHDSWLVLCFGFLLDFVCLCFLLRTIKLNKNLLSFDDILNKILTPVGAKVVLLVFFVMFMTRVLVLVENCYNTYAVIFDVNTNWLLFILPVVCVAGFAICRGFNSVARVSQILFAPVVLAIVAIAVYPLSKVQFNDLLPIAEVGVQNIVRTSFLRCHWFSDYVFVYFVLEDIKPQKRVFLPILTTFCIGAILTVALNVVFVSLFGSLAQFKNIAMAKIGLFSGAEATKGRWDWLTLSVWITSVIVKIVIFIFCAYKCVERIFRMHFTKANFAVLGVIFAILTVPMFVSIDVFADTFMYWCVVPFAILQYVLPFFMPLMTKRANRQCSANNCDAAKLTADN